MSNRKYVFTLNPATITDGGFSMMMHDPNSRKWEIEASGLVTLEADIRRLARDEFKRTCSAFIRVADGKNKPRGFDAMLDRLQIIEYEGEQGQQAA